MRGCAHVKTTRSGSATAAVRLRASRVTSVWLVIALCLSFAAPVRAEPSPCKANPALVAECFWVRGRVSAYNGNPTFRLWPVGTKRLLGVVPAGVEALPENLRSAVTFDQSAFGTFEVCPMSTERPGVMRFVCIESASDLSFHPRQP